MSGTDPDGFDVERFAFPAAFAKAAFGWEPYPYQEEVMEAILRGGKRRIAWVAGRRVGKTETVAIIALQLAIRKPGTKIAIFAPTGWQASILSKRVKFHLAGSPYAQYVIVDNLSELRLRLGVDARGKPVDSVIFANSLTSQVRGEGADVLIIDESAFCDSEDYRSKALPFVADKPNDIIIHISTVFNEDDHFMEALREYPKHPHGAVFRTPTRMKPGVTEEKLAEYRKTMREGAYRREYECDLVADTGVFDRDLLRTCSRDYELADLATLEQVPPKRHHAYRVGVDWGKKQDRAVIAVTEQGTQEQSNPAKLVFLQVYEPDPQNPRHYSTILDDIRRVANHYSAQHVVADEGEGGHQAEVLRRMLGSRFQPFRFTARSRNRLVDNARMLVEKRSVELPMEPEGVRQAFANVQRAEDGYRHASRESKDVFDAIALALPDASEAAAREGGAKMRIETASRNDRIVGGPMPRFDMRRVYFPEELWQFFKKDTEEDT
jgi:terminase large subunit-like protein